MKKIIFFLFANVFVINFAFSQGAAINTTGASADPSAMLDIKSTTSGLLIPRMTEAQRIAITSPATGLMVYQTDNVSGFWYYNGIFWVQAIGPAGANGATGPTGPTGSGGAPCTGAPATPGVISGNVAVCAGAIGIYFVASVPVATSYTWTYSGTGAAISGTGNSVIISFSSSATSGNLSVTASNACGTSASSTTFAVTINAIPVSTFTSYPSTLVSGLAVIFTPTVFDNQSYFWQTPDPTINSTATSPTLTLGPTFGNISLTVTKNGCSSTTVIAESQGQGFLYSGAQQTFTVPAGVTSVTIDAFGAQGGEAATGGKGGEAKGSLAVTPGQILYIYVGQRGDNYNYSYSGSWNGGGLGAWPSPGGSNGGGATDVRIGGTNLSDRIIVAGAGGGSSNNGGPLTAGGDGGGYIGAAGLSYYGAPGGLGGTQSSGGAGGQGFTEAGSDGSLGQGGIAWNAGGGGGGYYGGGAGGRYGAPTADYRGGGGGGSSYFAPSVTVLTNNQGVQSGDGQLIITW